MNGEINVVDPILLSKSIISEAFDTISNFIAIAHLFSWI